MAEADSDRRGPYYLTADPTKSPLYGKTPDPEPTPSTCDRLDHRKLSVEPPRGDDPNQRFRFRDFAPIRDRLKVLARESPLSPGQQARFRDCGVNAWVHWSASRQKHRVSCDTCKLRICPACSRSRGNKVASILAQHLEQGARNAWKLITLTLRHSSGPLREQLANLKASFRRLRQRKSWRAHVTGGYAVVEVTINPATGQWHPHMHVLAWCKYYDKRELSEQWRAASKGSYIVDVKQVITTAGVTHYLTKYMTKGVAESVLTRQAWFNEWVDAMAGSRLLIGFGRVPKLNDDPPDDGLANDWEPRHSLVDLMAKEAAGNDWAIAIMRALRKDHDEIDTPLFGHT